LNLQGDPRLRENLNRLAVVTFILVLLKLFTYIFNEFLPVFGEVINKLLIALLPFILAFLIAFLLEPLVTRFMRGLRLRRPYAAVVALIFTLLFIGVLIFFIVVRLHTELSELAITLPSYSYFFDMIHSQMDAFQTFLKVNPQIQSTLDNSTQAILNTLQDWAKTGSLFLLNFLSALPGFFIVLVVTIVATLLMSSSFPGIKRFFGNLIPRKYQIGAQRVSEDLGMAIFGFIRGMSILISVTGIILTIGLLILGNRYAFTIGFTAALLDLLPIVGTGIIFIPWAIGLFIVGSVSYGLKILLLWVFVTVVRQILEPKIMSHNIGLHPLPTLMSMYIGLKLFGGVGLILGPGLVIVFEALRKAGIFTDPKE
jgi:sporulation integral membrane protein YtvI